jgi:hypothetical protein
MVSGGDSWSEILSSSLEAPSIHHLAISTVLLILNRLSICLLHRIINLAIMPLFFGRGMSSIRFNW